MSDHETLEQFKERRHCAQLSYDETEAELYDALEGNGRLAAELSHQIRRASKADDCIDAALALHFQSQEAKECFHCGGEYPCLTVEALQGKP